VPILKKTKVKVEVKVEVEVKVKGKKFLPILILTNV